jgi:hypothetical protein
MADAAGHTALAKACPSHYCKKRIMQQFYCRFFTRMGGIFRFVNSAGESIGYLSL